MAQLMLVFRPWRRRTMRRRERFGIKPANRRRIRGGSGGCRLLYALHEVRHALLAPWNTVAAAHRDLLTNPFSPLAYLPSSRRIAAGFDVFCRITQRYEKPEFGLSSTVIGGSAVAVEERVAIEKPFCRLVHFRR